MKWRFLSTFYSVILISCVYVSFFYYVTCDLNFFSFIMLFLSLFSLGILYAIGDELYEKNGNSLIKCIGGVALGSISIMTSLVTFFYLLLFFHIDREYLALLFFLSSLFFIVLSLFNANRLPKIKTLKIDSGILNGSKKRLIFFSDLHLNGLKRHEWLKNTVRKINAVEPDIILFGGDFMDVSEKHLEGFFAELSELSKVPCLAVSGNHDFYVGYDRFLRCLKQSGFECVDYQKKSFSGVTILGVPDAMHQNGSEKEALYFIKSQSEKASFNILLSHRPSCIQALKDNDIQLALFGHTHGGQLPPFGLLTRLFFKYIKGRYIINDNICFTSTGLGTWGPPMKLFSKSEVILIELS